MKLALIVGASSGKVVKTRLQGIKDNLNIDVFDTIPEFIDSALKRNCIYDRILAIADKLNEKTLSDLHKYWGSSSKETRIVILCKKGSDNAKANQFLGLFNTPVVAVMLVDTTTVSLIAEAVLRPTAELNKDYGVQDFFNVEVEEEMAYVEPPKPQPKPQTESQPAQAKTEKSVAEKPSKKKRGFFGALFGGGKKSKESKKSNNQEQTEDLQDTTFADDDIFASNSNIQEAVDSFGDIGSDNASMQEDQNYEIEEPVVEETVPTPAREPVQQTEVFQEPVVETPSSPQKAQVDVDTSSSHHIEETDSNLGSAGVVEEPIDMAVEASVEAVATEVLHETHEEVQYNDFEPEVNPSVDASFEGVDWSLDVDDTAENPNTEVHYSMGETIEEVDTDLSGIDTANAEEDYRKSTDAPKIVTQVVTKEVIRNVNTGTKLTALDGVYSGRLRKIIVVTGDRGTGVTSTAFNIAQTLSKKVDVLYFDCDIDNHGLLNYIDYSNFKNYENAHMEGVKLCRNSKAFDRCVMNWDENTYLLTTDYSCDATVEDLQQTAQIVAERSTDFSAVVVDCPASKLPYIQDLILQGVGVLCIEGSKRGFMNMLCTLEASTLPVRYKRTFVSRGVSLVTKCNKRLDLNKLVNYIKAVYEPSDVDWLANKPIPFNGKLPDKLLNDILEG